MCNIWHKDEMCFNKVKDSAGKEEAAHRTRHPDSHMWALVISPGFGLFLCKKDLGNKRQFISIGVVASPAKDWGL